MVKAYCCSGVRDTFRKRSALCWVDVNNLGRRTRVVATYLVEGVVNLGKLLWGEVAGVDAFDFAAKVGELGRVCRGREGKRGELDGHG